jgi:hypothetical protein
LFSFSGFAGIGPENVALIVNSDSWASKTVANEFIKLRDIPPENVIYISGIKSFDGINIDDFRAQILSPILKTIQERGLAGQIDCIAYSSDFPTVIDARSDMQGKNLPPALSPQCSITGLTYLYGFVLAKNPVYLDFNVNLYARRVVRQNLDIQWTTEERNEYAKTFELMKNDPKNQDATAEQTKKNLEEAIKIFDSLTAKHPNSADLLYNMACCLSKLGKEAQAIECLEKSHQNGWFDWAHTSKDDDLKALREKPEFKKIIEKMKNFKPVMTPTQGFKAVFGWDPAGQPINAGQKISYILSTMLACTSGRGMSVQESLEYLRTAVTGDFTRPKGTIYFERNGDVRSTAREWGFHGAAEKLKSIGIQAIVEDGTLPQNKNDVAGTVVGAAGFEWKKSGSRILPGAICEHLTSCGGMMGENDGQTPLTEFLRNGAAGASGTVTEPYAIQAKFPTPYIQAYYAEGSSLAEAFYQSISGPYQLLIIGDPLCKPWGKKIDVCIMGMLPGQKLSGEIKILPIVTASEGLNIIFHELFIDGKKIMAVKSKESFTLDTKKISDGYHEIQVVSTCDDKIISQGRFSLPVEVRNSHRDLKASLAGGPEFSWDKPIEINAECPEAEKIIIKNNSLIVGQIDGAKGVITIDLRVLGAGPARLKPLALFKAEPGKEVYGKPLDINVIPPKALPPLNPQNIGELKTGFIIKAKDKAQIVAEKIDNALLDKAEIHNETEFSIKGFFDVDKDDIYQFQFNISDLKIKSLKIDDNEIDWPALQNSTWWFAPVNLGKGIHKLEIDAVTGKNRNIDIRFGGPGSKKLNGQKFKHREIDEFKVNIH